jgi:hypothetical protein
MSKKRTQRPKRRMKPVFLVFCEGETEEIYVNFLRLKYRLPVKVITYVTGLSISPKQVKKFMASEQMDRKDVITSFLLYDLDTEGISEKLSACTESINIASNPCVELWFLLHCKEQHAAIATANCVGALKITPEWTNYKKGTLSNKQEQILWDMRITACTRAKSLTESANPSSMVFRLIEAMEKEKN